jgi:hypothetical protein
MTGVRAMLLVMGSSVRLDAETADRMLAGRVDPADAPPGFEAVGELLERARTVARRPVLAALAARQPADLGPAEKPTHATQGRQSMLVTTPRLRLSVLAAVAALSAMTGAAYAAGLPAAASSTASAVLQHLGITNPAPNSHAHTPPAGTHGSSVSTLAKTTTAGGAAKGAVISAAASDGRSHAGAGGSGKPTTGGKGSTDASGHGKGTEISTLARTTTATGRDKGAVISTAASGGKSHAGQHGGGSSGHGRGKATGPGHSHSGAGAGHGSGS